MRLYNSKMNSSDNTKQVRVDNWGVFFLQRLQMFFSKTDYCDMTLQFEGNVQLKVHRLVMNACTEYFQVLEETCGLDDEGTIIMMPNNLQADVIVPIVNFMYTGMLEFHYSIFDKLYKAAKLMNINILTKLLDAQRQTPGKFGKKKNEAPSSTPIKKTTVKSIHHAELPSPLPGRKLPVWKRKNLPTPSPQSTFAAEPKWSNQPLDPLSVPDNTPKPTRFEWPDDDPPTLSFMDTSFEDISYTSKPLLTREDEQRAGPSFDDLKHIPNANRTNSDLKKTASGGSLDMEEMKNYAKEQKIRSCLEEAVDDDLETLAEVGQKRKAATQAKIITKKVRFDEQDSKTATISIAADPKNAAELDHEKIVAELLKKYPDLVKKNKNIKLKIMPKAKNITIESNKTEKKLKPRNTNSFEVEEKTTQPWVCQQCSTVNDQVEFVLYYLYRKHMTDVHNESFDPKLCKYCGHRCNKENLLIYHLYTKHGMKPPPNFHFPNCEKCPYIALSAAVLDKHRLRHRSTEMQCVECKLTFVNVTVLTSHMQITGHTGKTQKNNYDCQYCTKRYHSAIDLFTHVKGQHMNEARRDGIVSIDEDDDYVDYDEEDEADGEYILPEIISEPETPGKKVNILSNVKVQSAPPALHRQQMALEPSSEAEALNNVATGIATSLGLVEYVVLNENNSQLFLQANQQGNFTNAPNEHQSEFILPELTRHNQGEVMTSDGGLLSGSTDELVMVLTDHDYGDNQEEINSDNSNIVVLYSHPVEGGQQEQFITSQGNIMVNSQTGLIEIRNNTTLTSSENQSVMNQPEPEIESIEMIKREIEGHTSVDIKPEVIYVEQENNEPEIAPPKSPPASIEDTLAQGEQLEFVAQKEKDNQEQQTESKQEVSENDSLPPNAEPEPETIIDQSEIENLLVDEAVSAEFLQSENDKSENKDDNKKATNQDEPQEAEKTASMENEDGNAPEAVQPIEEKNPIDLYAIPNEDSTAITEENQPEADDANTIQVLNEKEMMESSEEAGKETTKEECEEKLEKKTSEDVAQEEDDKNEDNDDSETVVVSPSVSSADERVSSMDERSQEGHKGAASPQLNEATKIAILDDWEDTDSQSSETQKNVEKDAIVAVETVNKLMDDWEEEEGEDEERKDHE